MNAKNTKTTSFGRWLDRHSVLTATIAIVLFAALALGLMYADSKMGNSTSPFAKPNCWAQLKHDCGFK